MNRTIAYPHHRWRRRFGHSLRLRLVAAFVVLALATTLVVGLAMRHAFGGGWTNFFNPLVRDYVDRLAEEIGSPPSVDKASALAARLPITIRIDGPMVQWDSRPHEAQAPDRWREDTRGGAALLTRTTADGHRLRFGLNPAVWQERPVWVPWLVLAVLLLLTLAAYGAVRRLFRPIDDIRAGALRYGQGDFSRPIPVRRRDELGDLAEQVNTMAGDLGRMLEGQRALLLGVSHELRSPLTRARLNAELVAEGQHRDALLADLQQMRDLISDLLESERLAAGQAALQREPLDLNALVREVLQTHFAGRAIDVMLDPSLPTLPLDRVRMAMLVRNLVDNALRHSGDAAVHLTTQRSAGSLRLTVRDLGPGVPEDQLVHLAEPFYRTDSARARATGGVGLGLALCRLVARSHGGEMSIRNANPGLEIAVSLPVG